MCDYFVRNPLKVISSVILSIGFILLLSYYWTIQYVPEINIESITGVLISIAVSVTLIVLVSLSIFFYSAIVWPTSKDVLPVALYWSMSEN